MRKAYLASTLKTELRAKLENYRAVAQAKILNSVIRQRTEVYSDRLHSLVQEDFQRGGHVQQNFCEQSNEKLLGLKLEIQGTGNKRSRDAF